MTHFMGTQTIVCSNNTSSRGSFPYAGPHYFNNSVCADHTVDTTGTTGACQRSSKQASSGLPRQHGKPATQAANTRPRHVLHGQARAWSALLLVLAA